VYAKKVRKLESAEYLAVNKPALELNIGAANRFISHAIPDLNADQKAALKQVMRLISYQQRLTIQAATPHSVDDVLCTMCCAPSEVKLGVKSDWSCRLVQRGNRQTRVSLGALLRWLEPSLNRRLGVIGQRKHSKKQVPCVLSDKYDVGSGLYQYLSKQHRFRSATIIAQLLCM